MKTYTTNELIGEVKRVAAMPYCDWQIGLSATGKLDDEGCLSTVVFNPFSSEACMKAYEYFKAQGMSAKPLLAGDTQYLYLFKKSWAKAGNVNF